MMNPCRSRLFLGIFALSTLSLLACSSSDSPSGAGGSSGGKVTSSGGVSAGGTTTSPPASGGALPSAGTPASGGQTQAGSVAQGGSDTGGAATSAAGQTAPGGSVAGTSAAGGATGGRETGGSPTAGKETGGSPAAGSVAGGSKIGGSVAGGSMAAGSVAGGSVAAGSVAAGSVAAGSVAAGTTAGGSVAGGSKAGGSVAGGTTTGGVASGGVATGGKTSTGSPGGAAAGGAIVVPSTGTYPVSAGTPTIYLAGDSTCQTYATNAKDQQGWGQRFQEFFNTSDVLVVNKAMGGRSSKSYIDEGRLTEILAVIKPGDYLFAQWGINDRYTSDATRYTNPATTFRTYLKQYIDGARGKNAIPVLLTPTVRHPLNGGTFTNGYVDYCAAIMAVGAETNTPVIDVQSMALAYYTKIGDPTVSSTLLLDALHFVSAGAYQMARLAALGVSALGLPISPKVIQSKLAAH